MVGLVRNSEHSNEGICGGDKLALKIDSLETLSGTLQEGENIILSDVMKHVVVQVFFGVWSYVNEFKNM